MSASVATPRPGSHLPHIPHTAHQHSRLPPLWQYTDTHVDKMALPGFNMARLSTTADNFPNRRCFGTIEDMRTDIRERENRSAAQPKPFVAALAPSATSHQ
eukprot:453010-Prymnesium_polylepis.1